MVLDSSAIISVLLKEPGFLDFIAQMDKAPQLGVGAPTLAETALVLSSRLGQDARPLLSRFLDLSGVEVIPFHARHYEVAVDAFLRFGKGRHPAALNFGDCMAYAVARVAGVPLLCKGRDFELTDLSTVS